MSRLLPETAPSEHVVIVDFGSQTAQLIARRARELGVFAWLVGSDVSPEDLAATKPTAIILSGGPASVYEEGVPTMSPKLLELGVPVLGICYGMQLSAHLMGLKVGATRSREYGRAALQIVDSSDLLSGLPQQTSVWMSHGDQVDQSALDEQFITLASTVTCPAAAVRHRSRPIYGVQFHPEVTHTPHGTDILRNFLFHICRCTGQWKMSEFVETEVVKIRERVNGARVICGLSGGVDSSVCAALLARALGDQVTCVFIDNGLLRKNERALVESVFRDHSKVELRVIDASKAFLDDLSTVTDPQEKRRRIGHRFIEEFRRATGDLENARFLAQGTLYPDVIESGHGASGHASGIKLHHNVGGLPEELGFDLVEPLRDLFKDEVRKLGSVLGLPDQVIWRHPFPGPGLAVRVIGEVTEDRLAVLRDCDEIFMEEIVARHLYRQLSQAFAVLLPIQTVGVMGDARTYEHVVALRAVETQDFMTADWAHIPHDVLATISTRIINEVKGVNRVVYDISSKPPATIEWE